MKLQLTDDARLAWRMWSVRLNALGTLLLTLFLTVPETMLTLWGFLPPETRAVLPPRVVAVLPLILFIAANVARVIKQEKLHGRNAT